MMAFITSFLHHHPISTAHEHHRTNHRSDTPDQPWLGRSLLNARLPLHSVKPRIRCTAKPMQPTPALIRKQGPCGIRSQAAQTSGHPCGLLSSCGREGTTTRALPFGPCVARGRIYKIPSQASLRNEQRRQRARVRNHPLRPSANVSGSRGRGEPRKTNSRRIPRCHCSAYRVSTSRWRDHKNQILRGPRPNDGKLTWLLGALQASVPSASVAGLGTRHVPLCGPVRMGASSRWENNGIATSSRSRHPLVPVTSPRPPAPSPRGYSTPCLQKKSKNMANTTEIPIFF